MRLHLCAVFVSAFAVTLILITAQGCSKAGGAGSSYDFSSAATVSLGLKSRAGRTANLASPYSPLHWLKLPTAETSRTDGPTLCGDSVCVTPTKLTGKYYGSGFLIQSGGNGMVAYFGQDAWSTITGTSDTYNFDSSAPITNSGDLKCCGGTGDLTSANTYIEDIIYLFGYIDATFALTGITGNTSMNQTYTVRFVLADGAIPDGKRGDLLLKDPTDSTFKWMDTSVHAGGMEGAGTLVTARPTTPVMMDTKVTDWENPFGTKEGNQTIPVIYAPVLPESGTGVFTITEAELKTVGRAYTYSFDPTNFVMFPDLIAATDLNMLSDYTSMLQKIHLGGLPYSTKTMGVGSPAGTVLTVTEP